MKNMLNDNEAAIKLGITKELLYAYVKNAPKKCLGHNRKLNTEVVNGKNYFNEKELEDFDSYLREPWANTNEPRPEIPKYIQEYLKVEIEGKCPISGKGYPLENAHIVPFSKSLNHHHHNLIRIAKEEHTKVDNGLIPIQILIETKKRLIEKLISKIETSNNFLEFPNIPTPNPYFLGRIEELAELTNSMSSEKLILIEGIGGIGKTQLLLTALRSVQYHNPIIWIDVENILRLDDLVFHISNNIKRYITDEVSKSLVDSLKNIQITIILDSLENLLFAEKDEVENFIEVLITNTEYVQLIITSQVDLSLLDCPKKILTIEALSDEYCHQLIKLIVNNHVIISKDDANWIVKFSNGHPLTIKLIASLFNFYKSSKLAISRLKELGFLQHPTKKKHNKSTSLRTCLATVSKNLTKEQLKIVQYVKHYAAGAKLELIKSRFNSSTFIDDIATLQSFFLVEVRTDVLNFERVFVSNSIRPFLYERDFLYSDDKTEADIQKEVITDIMIEAVILDSHYIEKEIFGSASYGLDRIDVELGNIINAFHVVQNNLRLHENSIEIELKDEYLLILSSIAGALGKYCFSRGYFNFGIMFSKAGIEANIKLKDFINASMQYMYLAQIQSRQFDLEEVSNTVKELNDLAKETAILEVKANAAWAEGRLEFDRCNYDQSLILYERAISLLNEIKRNRLDEVENPKDEDYIENSIEYIEGNICIIMFEKAKIFEYTKRYDDAIIKFKEVLEISERIKDQINLPNGYHHLAHCYCEIEQFEKGIEYYSKAIIGFRNIGQFDYVINSMADLGRYVERKPDLAQLEILDEELIAIPLQRVKYQLINHAKRVSANNNIENVTDNIPWQLLGNIILLFQLIGLSSFRHMLTEIFSEIVEEMEIKNTGISYLSAIINVGYAIGCVDQWNNHPNSRKLMINAILLGCLIINGGPDLKSKSRIFYWLATWMRHVNIDKRATAEKLFEQAMSSVKSQT